MVHTATMIETLLLSHRVCTENCGIWLSSFMEEKPLSFIPLNRLGTQGVEMLTGNYDYFLIKGRKVSFIHGARPE